MATVVPTQKYLTSSYCSSFCPSDNYIKKHIKLKKSKWTLANLNERNKQIIYKHIRRLLFQQKVEEFMKAFSWILFAIGIGILFNFGRILNIIETLVN